MMDSSQKDELGDELTPYSGRWVAIINKHVISQGGTPQQALIAAKNSRTKESPKIVYIPTKEPLQFIPPIDEILSVLPSNLQIFLVGGAIRDAILYVENRDLDFVVPEDGLQVGRYVANRLKAAFYPLDEERKTGRVIQKDDNKASRVIDFTVQQGPDLESDLLARDFTINAIAVDINQPQALLDPLCGTADLNAGILRACSPHTFDDDPIRIVRGIRIAAALDFKINPKTRTLMAAAVPKLPQVSPERFRDEFFRILDGPQVSKSIKAMDYLKILKDFFPELGNLKEITQPPPHNENVWDHTLATIDYLRLILNAILFNSDIKSLPENLRSSFNRSIMEFQAELADHLTRSMHGDRSIVALLNLAALYHDAGKYWTKSTDEFGNIHFHSHKKIGEKLIISRARILKLSNQEIYYLSKIIGHYMRPLHLIKAGKIASPRAVYRYFKDTGSSGIDICLLVMADTLATYQCSPPNDFWNKLTGIIYQFFDSWFNHNSKFVSPQPLINGDDLIEKFGLKPGPIIGQLLEIVKESQVEGSITTKKEAIELVRHHLYHN